MSRGGSAGFDILIPLFDVSCPRIIFSDRVVVVAVGRRNSPSHKSGSHHADHDEQGPY